MMKFLAFIAIFYFLFWYVLPFLLRIFLKKKLNEFQKKGAFNGRGFQGVPFNPYNTNEKRSSQQTYNHKDFQGYGGSSGEYTTHTKANATKNNGKIVGDNAGEYVDYEEVK